MSKIFKKYCFIFLAVMAFIFCVSSPVLAETTNKFSITDKSVTQKIVDFFTKILNSVTDFWKKYIGEPMSRVWDKIRFFFINGVMTKTPEVKKELIKEVGEIKTSAPKQAETFWQKIKNLF